MMRLSAPNSTRESLSKSLRRTIVILAPKTKKLTAQISPGWCPKKIALHRIANLSQNMTRMETNGWSEKEKESLVNNWRHWWENSTEILTGQRTLCLRFLERQALVRPRSTNGAGIRRERSTALKQPPSWWLAAAALLVHPHTSSRHLQAKTWAVSNSNRMMSTHWAQTAIIIIIANKTTSSVQVMLARWTQWDWFHSLIPLLPPVRRVRKPTRLLTKKKTTSTWMNS